MYMCISLYTYISAYTYPLNYIYIYICIYIYWYVSLHYVYRLHTRFVFSISLTPLCLSSLLYCSCGGPICHLPWCLNVISFPTEWKLTQYILSEYFHTCTCVYTYICTCEEREKQERQKQTKTQRTT